MESGKNIKVIARFRPENNNETNGGGNRVVKVTSEQTCQLDNNDFVFDRVFDMDSTQNEVFDYSLKQTVDDLINGYNGTVFAYGQTGSGKSYTMMGPDIEDEQKRGAIPRMVDQIFEKIMASPDDTEYMVRVSYMEIYMERIRDLLNPTNDNLAIHEDKTRGIHVKNLTEEYVSSAQEVYQVMQQGASLRAVASTNMNQESSRSHSIFMVVVSQKNLTTGTQKSGQLFLVDLAGSEKVGKTGASGQTLEEAKKINKSLSALGNVINALTDGKSSHIPYRDSKLTRILQESLGGNSRTSLIVNCSPSSLNMSETLSTLRFGVRAKTIKNKARVNTELSPTELRSLLKKCQKQLDEKTAYAAELEKKLKGFQGELSRSSTPDEQLQQRTSLLRSDSPTWDSEEVMKRENELQDQIADRDAIIERQEQELRALRSSTELERLKFEKQELEVRIEALLAESTAPAPPQHDNASTPRTSMVQTPTPESSPVQNKKRRVTAAMMGEYYQKSQVDLVDDALNALSQLSGENQEAVLNQVRASLERMQQLPEYRCDKILEEDRASFKTLVDDSDGKVEDLFDAKVRAHEDTIVKLMNQVEELTSQNNELHTRLKNQSPSDDGFETVKQSLMRDLQNRCERIVELEISLDQARDQYNYAIKNGYNKSQQKKMALLERNLDQLTIVQKQLVEQNIKLKRESAVATKLLNARNDRISELENSLQNAESQLKREHGQFEAQLQLLTERIKQLQNEPSDLHKQKIVKPLRGGGAVWNKINQFI